MISRATCSIGFCWVILAWTGCAHRPVAVARAPEPKAEPVAAVSDMPLSLAGDDTRVKISFHSSQNESLQEEFEQDDICFLRAGPWRIDCMTSGSWLTFAEDENDASPLLEDNPMWQVHASRPNSSGGTLMQFFGILFLVGASVDRVPSTLADYLDRPGPHAQEAAALAERLLEDRPLVLPGIARGGAFTVTMELTDSGRQALEDALEGNTDSGTGIRMVRSGTPRPHARRQ